MIYKDNIVTVQFKNKYGEGFGGREYSYYADVPLEVGQYVKVPTRYGDSLARVSKVGISEETMGGALRACLKHITKECVIQDENNNPQMDAQQTIDDFFK